MNQTNHTHLLITFYILFNIGHCTSLCNPHDKIVLLQIKNHFGKPSWLESWNANTDCCRDWSFLSCDDYGYITALSIDFSSYQFTTQNEIAFPTRNLSSPQEMRISSMKVNSRIPDCLSQLTKLRIINLSGIGLIGRIPSSLVQLPNLQKLILSYNNLSGRIPEFPTNSGIYNIRIDNNKLSGPLPTSLGLLSNLSIIILGQNKLNGSILPSIGLLSRLRWLDLSYNQFTGSIPRSFGNLSDRIYIELQGNQLTGVVPKSLRRVATTWMNLGHNKLIGDASFLFGRNKSWTGKIYLNNNSFHFNFSNVEIPVWLITLDVSHNKIYGSLPRELAELHYLDVSYNHLCGEIPQGCDKFGSGAFKHNDGCLCGPPLAPCK